MSTGRCINRTVDRQIVHTVPTMFRKLIGLALEGKNQEVEVQVFVVIHFFFPRTCQRTCVSVRGYKEIVQIKALDILLYT
jgi:hypothetical protein